MQDNQNQKLSILDYCNSTHLSPLQFVEDTVSGRISWKERKIGEILEQAKKGDVIVVTEISRLGRSAFRMFSF